MALMLFQWNSSFPWILTEAHPTGEFIETLHNFMSCKRIKLYVIQLSINTYVQHVIKNLKDIFKGVKAVMCELHYVTHCYFPLITLSCECVTRLRYALSIDSSKINISYLDFDMITPSIAVIFLLNYCYSSPVDQIELRHFPHIPRLVTSRFFLTSENATYRELSLIAQDSIGAELNEDDTLFKDLLDVEDEGEADLFEGDFHEGDIAGVSLSTVTSLDDINKEEETKNAIIHTFQRWPNAEIPYVISSSFNARQRSVIYEAMREFDRTSCVKWRPRSFSDRDYVHILKDKGCYSRVGRVGYGGQVLSLGKGCVYHGTAVHELLHAAGFWHEQSRPDRDNFVAVRWENIQAGKEDNFARYSRGEVSTLDLEYDLNSVMHYNNKAFSRNGHPTIVALSGSQKLGQKEGMSQLDVKKLNKLYECDKKSIKVDQCSLYRLKTPQSVF